MLGLLMLTIAAAQEPTFAGNDAQVNAPMQVPVGQPAWRDEFSGKRLDRSKWSFDTARNKQGWYNKELQYYSADRRQNLRIEQGVLIIEARHDAKTIRRFGDYGGQRYSSAKIVTKNKASSTYGFFEIRAKLPCAYGTWPAIWMMPEGSAPWPDGGEIDILEHIGSEPRIVHANLHTALFNHAKQTGRGSKTPLPTACSEFHRYQLDWRPDAILIGVDDRAYMRVRNDRPGGAGAWPFDKPFHLILNLALGGDWAAPKGMDDSVFPQRFEVDYVRVWRRP
ncbi:MAG: glycoside hydrolase family 16 protein [Sphingomicrobium sp.]